MPTLSASEYTTFRRLQAASVAYQNGKTPSDRHTSAQPVQSVSVLNAQLLASQASLVVNPSKTVVVGNARVQPVVPGTVNHPKALSTIHQSTTGSSKFFQTGGLPSGRGNPGWVPTVIPRTSQG
jgi:hypothetical protein